MTLQLAGKYKKEILLCGSSEPTFYKQPFFYKKSFFAGISVNVIGGFVLVFPYSVTKQLMDSHNSYSRSVNGRTGPCKIKAQYSAETVRYI